MCGALRETAEQSEWDECTCCKSGQIQIHTPSGLEWASRFAEKEEKRYGSMTARDCRGVFYAALMNGVNCFDTAADYGKGLAENRLGKLCLEDRIESNYSVTQTLQFAGQHDPIVFTKILSDGRRPPMDLDQESWTGLVQRHYLQHGSAVHALLKKTRAAAQQDIDAPAEILFNHSLGVTLGIAIRSDDQGVACETGTGLGETWLRAKLALLCSRYRLRGFLQGFCLHDHEEAKEAEKDGLFRDDLKWMGEELGLYKCFGASVKVAEEVEGIVESPLCDYVSVPFNVLTAASLSEKLHFLRQRRPEIAVLARETLASGFLTGKYRNCAEWVAARGLPEDNQEGPEELRAVETHFREWLPAAEAFSGLAQQWSIPLGTAGALFALGSGLFDAVQIGFSSVLQARQMLDSWDTHRLRAVEFYETVCGELGIPESSP